MHLGAQDEQCFAPVNQGAPFLTEIECGNSCASFNARLMGSKTPLVGQITFCDQLNSDKSSADMECNHLTGSQRPERRSSSYRHARALGTGGCFAPRRPRRYLRIQFDLMLGPLPIGKHGERFAIVARRSRLQENPMDLLFTEKEQAFREEVRQFPRDNVSPQMRHKMIESRHASKEEMVTWWRVLNKIGLKVSSWPKEYGGTGWSSVQHYIFREELQMYPAPTPLAFGVGMVGPFIYTFGNEAQKKRLPTAHRKRG